MINITIIEGRAVARPETRTAANGVVVTRFSVAHDAFQKEKGADFFEVVAFGKSAETIQKLTEKGWLDKGRKVLVKGRLQTSSYEKEGRKVKKTEIVAESVELLDRPAGTAPAAPSPAVMAQPTAPSWTPAAPAAQPQVYTPAHQAYAPASMPTPAPMPAPAAPTPVPAPAPAPVPAPGYMPNPGPAPASTYVPADYEEEELPFV